MAHPSIADRPSEPGEPGSQPDQAPRPVKAAQSEAAQTEAGQTEAAPTGPARSRYGRVLAVVTALASGVALIWIVAAALASRHGFDITDEGYYLLSYRWWNVNDRTFTGVQYIYGPVFQALGWSIAGLRLFRLVTLVASLFAFGWSFMRWLRTRRPKADPSRWWEGAGTAAIVAAGGASYGWLPLSPGYNDVALLGSLLTLAVVFRAAADTERGRRVPAWIPIAWGPVVFAMLFAKWSSSMLVLLAAGTALIVVLWPRRYKDIFRFAGLSIAGVAVATALIHFLVVPLNSAIPEMLEVNKLVAGKTNSPLSLLAMYWRTSSTVWLIAVRTHGLLMLALIVAAVARGRWARLAWVLVAAGLALSAWRVLRGGGLAGGTVNLRYYPAVLMAVVMAVLVAGLAVVLAERLRKQRASAITSTGTRGWFLLILVLAMPYLHALGTGNAVHVMAVNGFACWMAVVVFVVTGMERAPVPARAATALVAAGAVLFGSSIGAGGLLLHPYRTKPYRITNATVAGVPALDSLRIDRGTANKYRDLHERLQPYLATGRPIMAFDEMAGIVLLLDGRPVGEAWYSRTDPARTAAGIRAVCEGGKAWWGSQEPLLIFRRPVGEVDRDAIQSCGLDIDSDYRRLAPPEQTMGLTVYVPEGEHS